MLGTHWIVSTELLARWSVGAINLVDRPADRRGSFSVPVARPDILFLSRVLDEWIAKHLEQLSEYRNPEAMRPEPKGEHRVLYAIYVASMLPFQTGDLSNKLRLQEGGS